MPLEGRTLLVTGGSSGTGLALVREAHRLGADVIAGSRSTERLAAISEELGGTRFHPFVADITNEAAVSVALGSLAETGLRMTDLVHSSAGGLESVVRPLVRQCVALRRVPQSDLPDAIEKARSEIAALVAASLDGAMKVNYVAARALIEKVASRLPAGGTLTVYTSLWTTFPSRTPHFYRSVASSKLALDTWIRERAPAWAERGITTAIVSGHIILDSAMGQLIDRFLVPLMPAEGQARFRSYYITTADMVRATIAVLSKPEPARSRAMAMSYVIGPHRILDELSADTPALADLLPL
jgi:NAD(P)-dependent dehydrogenase (short-subunit alcohol dehydrogenase family)